MQFIDTHIHLQDFKSRCATDIITDSQKVGVKQMVCAAVIEADWPLIANFAEQFPKSVVPAFGLHPWYLDKAKPGWESRITEYFQKFPQALVGETGLDRLRDMNPELQKQIFTGHIELAKQFNRPLIIHAVKANEWFENFWSIMPPKFVFHSYNGRREFAEKINKSGGYVSFSASILKNPHRQEIVQSIPPEKLLLETDGPYQGPTKGEEVEPCFLPELIKEIAAIREETVEILSSQIYQNSLEFIKVGK